MLKTIGLIVTMVAAIWGIVKGIDGPRARYKEDIEILKTASDLGRPEKELEFFRKQADTEYSRLTSGVGVTIPYIKGLLLILLGLWTVVAGFFIRADAAALLESFDVSHWGGWSWGVTAIYAILGVIAFCLGVRVLCWKFSEWRASTSAESEKPEAETHCTGSSGSTPQQDGTGISGGSGLGETV